MIDRNRSLCHFRIRNLMKIESYHILPSVELDLLYSLIKKSLENMIFTRLGTGLMGFWGMGILYLLHNH